MAFVKHHINTVNSDKEEYFYHLEQAGQFLEYAQMAHIDMIEAMENFHRHNDWLKEHSHKTFIA